LFYSLFHISGANNEQILNKFQLLKFKISMEWLWSYNDWNL
jgi:hypothetical protein